MGRACTRSQSRMEPRWACPEPTRGEQPRPAQSPRDAPQAPAQAPPSRQDPSERLSPRARRIRLAEQGPACPSPHPTNRRAPRSVYHHGARPPPRAASSNLSALPAHRLIPPIAGRLAPSITTGPAHSSAPLPANRAPARHHRNPPIRARPAPPTRFGCCACAESRPSSPGNTGLGLCQGTRVRVRASRHPDGTLLGGRYPEVTSRSWSLRGSWRPSRYPTTCQSPGSAAAARADHRVGARSPQAASPGGSGRSAAAEERVRGAGGGRPSARATTLPASMQRGSVPSTGYPPASALRSRPIAGALPYLTLREASRRSHHVPSLLPGPVPTATWTALMEDTQRPRCGPVSVLRPWLVNPSNPQISLCR